MTFDEVILALPKDTTLNEFKRIEQLIPRRDLKVVARVCIRESYNTLNDLFNDFLLVGYYLEVFVLQEVQSIVNTIVSSRRNRRQHELGLL